MLSMKLKRLIKKIWLFPLFMILGIPEGAEGGTEDGGNSILGGEGASEGSTTVEEGSEGEATGGQGGSEGSDEGDGKGAEGKDGESGDKEGEEKKEGAPEEYVDFTLPEGITADPEILGEFKDIAKEMNLSQEAAQKFVDLQVKTIGRMVQQQHEAFNTDVTTRRTAIQTDKEIGGDNLKATTETVERVLNTFLSADEKGELVQGYLAKYGDHVGLFKLLNRVGAAMSEDSLVLPGKGGAGKKSAAEIMFGSTS